jgi:glucose-1-phosphate adenylyltransferase
MLNVKKESVAMLLAGGQGSRLGALTYFIAKPAVSFGGKYRIIDFSLSNCINSGIDTVGVLTQYRPMILNSYIGTGASWDLNDANGGVQMLPPYMSQDGGVWYKGTANAIYQNLDFIWNYNPDYVLILSGDHIYKMDYDKMLRFHKDCEADVTISVIEVPWEEACRFGILTADEKGRIVRFEEKPKNPKSNLASMGIYIFNKPLLQAALSEDEMDPDSSNDFGKDVIPRLLRQGKSLYAYKFHGYWKDVGTIESYYNSNMELLENEPPFNIFESKDRILSNSNIYPPQYIGPEAHVENSLICNGCSVLGTVINSILSPDVRVAAGSFIKDSLILIGTRIEENCSVIKTIIGENTLVGKGTVLGRRAADTPAQQGITVIADNMIIKEGTVIAEGENVSGVI